MFLFLSTALAADFVAADYSSADKQVAYEGHLDAAPDAVYAALVDHVGMTDWMPKISKVSVDNSNAEAEGGVGCERTCSFGGMPINERVVWMEDGVGYAYVIEEGPVSNHVGVVRVADDGQGGTDLVWEQYFDAKGLKAKMMRKKMPKLLGQAVDNLDDLLLSEAPAV